MVLCSLAKQQSNSFTSFSIDAIRLIEILCYVFSLSMKFSILFSLSMAPITSMASPLSNFKILMELLRMRVWTSRNFEFEIFDYGGFTWKEFR